MRLLPLLLAGCGSALSPTTPVECTGTFTRDGIGYSVRHATRTQEDGTVYVECEVGGDSGTLRQEATLPPSHPDAERSQCRVSADTSCAGLPAFLTFSMDAHRQHSAVTWSASATMDIVVSMPCHEQALEPTQVEWR